MSSADLKKKHDMILSREQNLAKAIALKAIKPKPFSVWEVLIPIIFIFAFMKSREERELFAQNLLFTKKLALEAAFDMLKKSHSRESVVGRIKDKTDALLSTVPKNVYSEAIRQEQMREIDLLIDHYCKLIKAEGENYDALVMRAYSTRQAYSVFQEQLKSAEQNVTRAARQTLGTQADVEMAARIEAVTDQLRRTEIDRIFG